MERERKRDPKKITEHIYRVSGPDLTDPRDCAAYLINLGELVLIDSGSGLHLDRLVRNIERAGFDPAKVSTIILTHCHFDHMGGGVKFREQFGSRLVMHAFDAELVEAGDQRLTAAFCFNVRLEPYSVDRKLYREEEQLAIGGEMLTLLHTPGHTPGSISVYLNIDGKKILFAQDIGAPLLKEFDCNPYAWVESAEKLYALNADMLCDGHSGAYEPEDVVKEYFHYCIRSQYEQGYLPVQS
ncbi:MAG: MBL fold metallo-hydrolase [Syntrophobacterales bacterium]|jgi:glyoxylase-like metal-dependent hydrolase (beta-lactamase superfamily II)|nr:MBL fold metallo-hydrolase [Syntrophobacterales bacterium]